MQKVIKDKRFELFGKSVIQKIVLEPPFTLFPGNSDNVAFVYILSEHARFKEDNQTNRVTRRHTIFINSIPFAKEICCSDLAVQLEVLIINFYAEVLEKIYEKDSPKLFSSPTEMLKNISEEKENINFLIEKYVEGLLFYLDNPSYVNEDILILKLKEIILLLIQTKKAGVLRLSFKQLHSTTGNKFKKNIEKHIFSQITIRELAKQNNLSISSFKREFAKLYDTTPANYIKIKKLEKAAELLLASHKRVN